MIGVGKEKSQITTTLGAVEGSGKLLKTQYIFQGKTKKCHPKDAPTDEMGYFTHTESHWQTEKSFLEYLEEVIIPWKEETIHELGLPVDQKSILKMDLHYSHKTPAVLEIMRIHNILPLYVPAGCTDIIQECDTVINKPFKNAMKKAFRDYLNEDFQQFRTSNPTKSVSEWAPKLKMSNLKPKMVSFVEAGLKALQTPEMIQTIIKAFENDGRFSIMRSPDMQLSVLTELMTQDLNIVSVPNGDEVSNDDEEPAHPREFSDDANNNDDDDSDEDD